MSTIHAPRFASGCADLHVIVVDDEGTFRTSLAEILHEDGHPVHEYESSSAVPLGDSWPRRTILVTDYEMTGLDGIQLADAFHAAHPEAPVILLSAHRMEVVEARLAGRPFVRFLVKPVDYEVLHEVLHDLGAT